jgi:small basic protein
MIIALLNIQITVLEGINIIYDDLLSIKSIQFEQKVLISGFLFNSIQVEILDYLVFKVNDCF